MRGGQRSGDQSRRGRVPEVMSRACRAAARAIMFAGVLGGASCSSDGERPEKGPRGWTVLVYMAADNDLDPRYYNAAYDKLEAAPAWRSNVSRFFEAAREIRNGPSFFDPSQRAAVRRTESGVHVTGDLSSGTGRLVAESKLRIAAFDPDLFTVGIDADVVQDGVRATWDGRTVVARQGTAEDRPFFQASWVDGDLVVLSIQAVYSDGDQPDVEDATLEVVLEGGREVERTLYVTTADAIAEVHPAPGAKLTFGAFHFKPSEEPSWIPSGIAFDALAPIELSFQRTPELSTRRAVLVVSDVTGRSDRVEYTE